MNETHHELIVDQFTRQATPFSTAATITDENALRMIVATGRPSADDAMLDVACGGGIVVAAFAPHVRHATGIDMTPAMLAQFSRLAADKSLANVSFEQGDASALPYPDAAFTVVTTRFSFHHFWTRWWCCVRCSGFAHPAAAWSWSICTRRRMRARRRNGTGWRSCAIRRMSGASA